MATAQAQASLPCPYTANGVVETVAIIPYVRGYVLTHKVGARRLVGSVFGVRLKILQEAGTSLLIGWFSPMSLVLNPVFIVHALVRAIFLVKSPRQVAKVLKAAGLTPDGAMSVVSAGYGLAASMITADKRILPAEIAEAKAIGKTLFGDFTEDGFDAVLAQHASLPEPQALAGVLKGVLTVEQRRLIYEYLLKIASSDGEIASEERALLDQVELALGLDQPRSLPTPGSDTRAAAS